LIGLNSEQHMIAYAAATARRAQARRLLGEYIPTSKNKVAADMYARLGFKKVGETLFAADLDTQTFESPAHISPAAESFLSAA
jgi:predicted enzyme involved in methoxymalonyl-ACP biosynthesis